MVSRVRWRAFVGGCGRGRLGEGELCRVLHVHTRWPLLDVPIVLHNYRVIFPERRGGWRRYTFATTRIFWRSPLVSVGMLLGLLLLLGSVLTYGSHIPSLAFILPRSCRLLLLLRTLARLASGGRPAQMGQWRWRGSTIRGEGRMRSCCRPLGLALVSTASKVKPCCGFPRWC